MRKLFVILSLLGISSYCLAQKNLLYKFEFPYYYTLTVNADNTYGDEVVSYPIEGGWFELSFLLSSMGKSPTIKIRLNEYNQYGDKINSHLVSCLLIGVYFSPDLYEHDLEMFALSMYENVVTFMSDGSILMELWTMPSGETEEIKYFIPNRVGEEYYPKEFLEFKNELKNIEGIKHLE